MLALLLISAPLVALIAVWRRGPERAALGVVLPLMMLLPYGSSWKFHGVELDMMTLAAVPVAVALVVKHAHRWRYSIADLLVVSYAFSTLLSNWNADGQSAGLALGTASAFSCLPPYIIGRVAIEHPGLRLAWARRFAFLAFVISLVSVYEYRMERNVFVEALEGVFHYNSHEIIQIRWGFGRIFGPYGHAITAGCILISALIFAIWLASTRHWGERFRRLEFLPGRKAAYIVLGLLLGVWMTQSRGPWMGGAFGILLVLAARARNQKRALRNVALGSLLLFSAFYVAVNHYTDTTHAPTDQDQENAQYRRMLITNYTPTVEKGGVLGYGVHFPRIDGQVSIDNEYLNVTLGQGYLGLGIFLALITATGYRLLGRALGSKNREETSFALCLLGILVAIALTLTTVYLGNQVYTLFFLLAGWAQGLEPVAATSLATEPVPVRPPVRFAFRRVWS